MGKESSNINTYIAKSIMANNSFGITEVNDLESINSFYFIAEHYRGIEGLIKENNINAIKIMPSNHSDTFQYYYVMTFEDQKKKHYAVTVYDSNELWQDPQVIEIFPM
jgi:hypothetical protein